MNLVVWGLGKHAINKVIPAVNKSNKFTLYGVCTRDKKKLDEVKSSYKVMGWDSSLEMLKDENIDVIYLATPPAVHKEQAIAILDKGINLLCEKPITLSHADTAFLIEKARSLNLVVFEGLMYKHHPQYILLKDLIIRNKLGKINKIMSSFQLPPLDLPGYRTNKALGASAIYDLGIYPASLILGLFEYADIELETKNIKYDKILNYDIAGSAILRINNEIDCTIDWAYDKTYINEISISGEYLSLESKFIFSKDSTHKAVISLLSEDQLIENIVLDEADHFELMLESFFCSINDPQNTETAYISMFELSDFLDNLAK